MEYKVETPEIGRIPFSAGIFGAGEGGTFFSRFSSLRVFLGLLQVAACSWVFGLGFKAFLWIFPTSKELIRVNNPLIIFSSEDSDWKSKIRLICCRFLGSLWVSVGKSHSDNLHSDFWKLQGWKFGIWEQIRADLRSGISWNAAIQNDPSSRWESSAPASPNPHLGGWKTSSSHPKTTP